MPDVHDEMGCFQGYGPAFQHFLRPAIHLVPGGLRLPLCDVVLLYHEPKHCLLPLSGTIPVGVRVVICRSLGQSGQKACLPKREVGGVLAEICLRGCLDAVGQVAVVYLVQVKLQDRVLAVPAADLLCQDRLFDLAFQRPAGR